MRDDMTIAASAGFDPGRAAHFLDAIQQDIDRDTIDGAVVMVARRGKIAIQAALGYADRAAGRAMSLGSVFCTFSILKQLSNVALLQKIDRGDAAYTTLVSDIIPEYGLKGKGGTTVADLLLHRAGLPFEAPPLPPEQLGNIQAVTAYACNLVPETVPGTTIRYSAVIGHSVMAEIVRRLDGGTRSFSRIMEQDVLTPLRMADTSYGARADLVGRRVPVVVKDRRPGMFVPEALEGLGAGMTEGVETPAGAGLTTAADYLRFAEACRLGGVLDGQRILSPAIMRLATTDATGTQPNTLWDYAREMRRWPEIPSHFGLGFYLRGHGVFPTAFGTMASPETFGGIGAGSNCFWIDPRSETSYVFLSAGLMEDSFSWERHQRYADLVHAALVD